MSAGNDHILIVDDEPELCWVLERILKGKGCICDTALTASEAMGLARQYCFPVAFLDAKLPDCDGFILARQLKDINPDIRIVIVSGYYYRDDPTIAKAISSGLVSAFVAKPFDHKEIINLIGSLCDS